MDYNRIYEYRFKDVDKQKKLITWQIIADYLKEEINYLAAELTRYYWKTFYSRSRAAGN